MAARQRGPRGGGHCGGGPDRLWERGGAAAGGRRQPEGSRRGGRGFTPPAGRVGESWCQGHSRGLRSVLTHCHHGGNGYAIAPRHDHRGNPPRRASGDPAGGGVGTGGGVWEGCV